MTKLTKSFNILYQASTHPKIFMRLIKKRLKFVKILNFLLDKVYWELCGKTSCLLVPRLGREANGEWWIEWCRFFNRIIFNCQFIEYRNISTNKKLCNTLDLFSVGRVVLFNIYKIYKRLYIFQGDFEVLKLQYFNLMNVTFARGAFRT